MKDRPSAFTLGIKIQYSKSTTKTEVPQVLPLPLTEVAAAKHKSLGSHAHLRYGHEKNMHMYRQEHPAAMPTQQPMKQYLYHLKTQPPPIPSDLPIVAVLTFPASANAVEIANIDMFHGVYKN
jgi:hypothetical protein